MTKTSTSRTLLLAAGAGLALAACAPRNQLYQWSDYDAALYQHYKKPQEREAFVERLKTVILASEQRAQKVPPGCYAEYGYALYEEAQYDGAISYFQKERDLWPESRAFMEKMIRNAERQSGKGKASAGKASAGKGAARALEGK
jgi:hypothetical protein